MASRDRDSYPYWAHASGNNGSVSVDPKQIVLNVAPISCVPPSHPVKTAPSTQEINASASSTEINSGPCFGKPPAIVFFNSPPRADEWNNIITATKSGVALTGSAAKGKAGPAIGSVDIGESEDEYLFRISLPGVVRDANVFTCDVEPDGEIVIHGQTIGGRTVHKDFMVFQMQTQNLCPPGEFSISFRLPGRVDHQQPVRGVFGADGIFEAIVIKKSFQAGGVNELTSFFCLDNMHR